MFTAFYLGDNTDRTQNIAAYTRAFIYPLEGAPILYNQIAPWVSSDKLFFGLTQKQEQLSGVITMSEIQFTIESNEPFGALYGAYDNTGNWSGHWVVGTGYATAPGHNPLVVSNDPAGGVQRIQTYDEFISYYVGGTNSYIYLYEYAY